MRVGDVREHKVHGVLYLIVGVIRLSDDPCDTMFNVYTIHDGDGGFAYDRVGSLFPSLAGWLDQYTLPFAESACPVED